MSTHTTHEPSFLGIEQLSLRALILGALGSAVITASSMYIALRMGALPWPTIFVAVLSMALLKLLGNTTLNEMNVTQTAMSAGAMVAGGIAFTLPGLWISGQWTSTDIAAGQVWQVVWIAAAGVLLGTLLTRTLKTRFVEKDGLPYPIGQAAADTIQAGDRGGKKAAVLFGSMGASALFTYLRDSLALFPSMVTSGWMYARNLYVGIWLSPMAVGIGYMIGTLYTGVWFIGAVLAYVVMIPMGVKLDIFASAESATAFKNTAGIGLMIGTGIGILVSYVYKNSKQWLSSLRVHGAAGTGSDLDDEKNRSSSIGRVLTLGGVLLAFIFSILANLNPLAAVLMMVGTFVAATMAATITGQTGINPMEIFSIIILLAIRLLVKVDDMQAFFIAAGVAVACGYTGDLFNDYKTGHILGTNFKAQLTAQVVGGLVGAVTAAWTMFIVVHQFGGVGPDKGLYATQAFAVSQMVHGISDVPVFLGAAVLGMVLYLCRVPAMTLGMGLYLPFEISAAVFVGGLVQWVVRKTRREAMESGSITAAGFLGGEGVTGVLLAILRMVMGK